jgi:glycosyltransferase involved in cell wall biosynthesis
VTTDDGAGVDGAALVALLAHRVATGHATGIGRSYRELAVALAAVAQPDLRYVVASPNEGRTPDWAVAPLEYRALRGPRRLLQMSWTLLGRPTVDASLDTPDLVHTLHPWAPTPTRRPFVVTIHDLMPVLHPEWTARHHRHGLERGLRYARDHAARITVNSSWTGDMVHEHLGVERERITVTSFGIGEEFRDRPPASAIDDTCAQHGVEPGRFVIAVGAVAPRKNLMTVARAIGALDPALLGETALLAVGPVSDDEPAHRALTDAAGGRLGFTGFVADDALRALIGGALALVHPSLDEGFGFTPLEAMALGTPALASTSGALPEVVGDGGVLLAPDDPEAWAETIERLVREPGWREQLVAAGRRRQDGFRWEHTARAVADVHREVLGLDQP